MLGNDFHFSRFRQLTVKVVASAELAYKQLLRDPSFTEFVAQVPSLFSFDDHEIHDNADDVGSEFFQRNVKGIPSAPLFFSLL